MVSLCIFCHFITYVDSCNHDCNQDIECSIIIKFSLMLFFYSYPSPLCLPLNFGNHEYAFLENGFIIFKMHKWNHTLYMIFWSFVFFFTQNNAILSSKIILLLYEVLFTIFFIVYKYINTFTTYLFENLFIMLSFLNNSLDEIMYQWWVSQERETIPVFKV